MLYFLDCQFVSRNKCEYLSEDNLAGNNYQGFTLIELSIVIVVMGIILSIGVASWMSLMHGYEVSQTRATLKAIKSCLSKRMIYTENYPNYSQDLKATDCTNDNYHKTNAVDYCLCQDKYQDAWGNRIRYLGGVNGTNKNIQGKPIFENQDTGLFNSTNFPGKDSRVINKQGKVVQHVAFVLLSKGRNQKFEFTDQLNNTLVGNLSNINPDLSNPEDNDDQALIITGHELNNIVN